MSKKIGEQSKINANNDNDILVLSIHPRIVKIMIDNLILDFFSRKCSNLKWDLYTTQYPLYFTFQYRSSSKENFWNLFRIVHYACSAISLYKRQGNALLFLYQGQSNKIYSGGDTLNFNLNSLFLTNKGIASSF